MAKAKQMGRETQLRAQQRDGAKDEGDALDSFNDELLIIALRIIPYQFFSLGRPLHSRRERERERESDSYCFLDWVGKLSLSYI